MDSDATGLDPTWLAHLRDRFLGIARRRVPAAVLEDVVQDALTVVCLKGQDTARRENRSTPHLRWCFAVLRNVIGDFYRQRPMSQDTGDQQIADPGPEPLAALATAEQVAAVRRGLAELRVTHRQCADWLWARAEGERAGELAARAGLEPAVFSRRLYRCRMHLAAILERMGVRP